MDSVLLLTIGIILVAALIGAFLRGRRRDICLKSWAGYQTNVQLKTGKRIWGRLIVDSTGVEFAYRKDYVDSKDVVPHIETSFILYKSEFPAVDMFLRFLDELGPVDKIQRAKVIEESFHPGQMRRFRRHVRNAVLLTKDAIGEAMTVALSSLRLGRGGAAAATTATQQKSMGKIGGEVVESVGNAFDPILERHIGKMVVAEAATPKGEIVEYVGLLREYSADFLEVLDVPFPDNGRIHTADLIIPRAHGYVRHSAEPVTGLQVAPPVVAAPDATRRYDRAGKADASQELAKDAAGEPAKVAAGEPAKDASREPVKTEAAGQP